MIGIIDQRVWNCWKKIENIGFGFGNRCVSLFIIILLLLSTIIGQLYYNIGRLILGGESLMDEPIYILYYIIYNNTDIIWKEIKMTLRNWVRSVPMSRTGAATWAKTPRTAQKTTMTNPWLGVVLQIGSHDLRHNENQSVSNYSGRFGRIYCHVL